ncbi:MAG: DUF4115 domain-containing protein, partial [Elusimicrobia bacterium]|nr:DUF4115 domain-containing protein [Elusimicrobiota bacterium]
APLEKEKKEKQRSVEKLSLSSLGFHWEFFLLLPVVILLFWKFNPGKDKKTVKEKEAESSSFSDLSVPAKEFSLQVKFMEPSWIRLAIDGKLSFEGKVPGGVSQEWKGKESAVLRTTTPESIQVMLDGKSLSLDQLSRSPSGDFVLFSGRK